MGELSGKGMYIWIIDPDEDPRQTAADCAIAGLTHVAIKIADAGYPYNIKTDSSGVKRDLVKPLVQELRAYGIEPWGWQFVYGNMPDAEADIAISRSLELDLAGFIVNAEGQYKGKHAAAAGYMSRLRAGIGSIYPIALSSFRFPNYHPEFPWVEFLSKVDINMPQVYWMMSHNAGDQMIRCYEEFQQSKFPQVPIFPTGSAFSEGGWRASVEEIQEFMETAESLGLAGCNFWLYSQARHRFPEYWNVISAYDWPDQPDEAPQEPLPDGALFWAKCTATAWLRIRKGPGLGYDVLDYLAAGEETPVYEVDGAWYRIDRGWVSSSYMQMIAPPVVIEPEPTIVERVEILEDQVSRLLEIHPELSDAS